MNDTNAQQVVIALNNIATILKNQNQKLDQIAFEIRKIASK